MTGPRLLTDSDRIADALARVFSGGPGTTELLGADEPAGTDSLLVVGTDSSRFSGSSAHERLVVVDEDSPQNLAKAVRRLHSLLTGRERITPSRAEFGMHAAYGAALRSAAQRGGVGAALVDEGGDVLALGAAEVPRFGGGQYWEGDPDDARDFQLGPDPATSARTATVELLLEALAARGVGLPGPVSRLAQDVLADFDGGQGSYGVGHGAAAAQTFESLGRVVHAEMAALMSAARSGVRTGNTSLYVTGRPCRQCLRHLVCAGLRQVVYLGPRLSEAPPFHADSVSVRGGEPGRMPLLAFTGVGPGAYQHLFAGQMTRTLLPTAYAPNEAADAGTPHREGRS